MGYGGHQLRLNAPRCTTTAQQVRLHGSRCLRWSPTLPAPPRPRWFPAFINISYIIMPHRWSFTSVQTFHTHTHSAVGRVFLVQMRWRWGWRGKWGWYGSEGEMKKYLAGTWGGECKRRGREQTPIPTHLARSGQTLKGQEKRKAEADGHGTQRTEAPQPT